MKQTHSSSYGVFEPFFDTSAYLNKPTAYLKRIPRMPKSRAPICKGHLCGAHWSGTWNCHTKPVPLQTWNGWCTIKWSTLITTPKLPFFNARLLLLMGSGWLCKSSGCFLYKLEGHELLFSVVSVLLIGHARTQEFVDGLKIWQHGSWVPHILLYQHSIDSPC